MQAQPQSNLAARIPSPSSSPPSTPAPSSLNAPRPARFRALRPQRPSPAPSLAETTGLAHDAGNLLAALGLYCDLLNVPASCVPSTSTTPPNSASSPTAAPGSSVACSPVATTHDVPPPTTDAPPLVPPNSFAAAVHRASDVLANTSNHAAMLLNLTPVLRRIAAGAATSPSPARPRFLLSTSPPRSSSASPSTWFAMPPKPSDAQQARAPRAPRRPLGEIRVTLAVIADRLQLTVEDNGPGMPPTNVEAYLHPEPLAARRQPWPRSSHRP